MSYAAHTRSIMLRKIVLRNTSLPSRSSQSAPYTVNHVAQHAMLRNMIDHVWAPLGLND
jgi:hypothetical protein